MIKLDMTSEEKAELNILIDAIKNSIDTKAIYLFGSFAYGTPNTQSDFDIYVVIPDGTLRPLLATQKLRLAIMPHQKRPVDLLVGNHSNFEKRKKNRALIENEVFTKGVKIA